MKIILSVVEFEGIASCTFLFTDLIKKLGMTIPAAKISDCGNAEELLDFMIKQNKKLISRIQDNNGVTTHVEFIVPEFEVNANTAIAAIALRHLNDDTIISAAMSIWHGAKMVVGLLKSKVEAFKADADKYLAEANLTFRGKRSVAEQVDGILAAYGYSPINLEMVKNSELYHKALASECTIEKFQGLLPADYLTRENFIVALSRAVAALR